MRTLERSEVVVVAPEHECGRRKQLEVVSAERRVPVGAGQQLVGVPPSPPFVGLAAQPKRIPGHRRTVAREAFSLHAKELAERQSGAERADPEPDSEQDQ